MNPSVSVIIPVFNGEKYLRETLQSVMNQTLRPSEICVVDDGSTDQSAALAESFAPSVRVARQEHLGAGSARNLGVEVSRGDFIAFLDADDLWNPRKLELQIGVFQSDPDLDMVFCQTRQFLSPELESRLAGIRKIPLEVSTAAILSALMVKRHSFLRVGDFPTGDKIGEGIDWHLRAQEKKLKMHLYPEVLVERRVHETNLGILKRTSRNDYLHVLKSALDRRRTAT